MQLQASKNLSSESGRTIKRKQSSTLAFYRLQAIGDDEKPDRQVFDFGL